MLSQFTENVPHGRYTVVNTVLDMYDGGSGGINHKCGGTTPESYVPPRPGY